MTSDPTLSRAYAVIGFEGLAPSFFDVEGALFLSNKGELLARAEGYSSLRRSSSRAGLGGALVHGMDHMNW